MNPFLIKQQIMQMQQHNMRQNMSHLNEDKSQNQRQSPFNDFSHGMNNNLNKMNNETTGLNENLFRHGKYVDSEIFKTILF